MQYYIECRDYETWQFVERIGLMDAETTLVMCEVLREVHSPTERAVLVFREGEHVAVAMGDVT